MLGLTETASETKFLPNPDLLIWSGKEGYQVGVFEKPSVLVRPERFLGVWLCRNGAGPPCLHWDTADHGLGSRRRNGLPWCTVCRAGSSEGLCGRHWSRRSKAQEKSCSVGEGGGLPGQQRTDPAVLCWQFAKHPAPERVSLEG